VKCIGISNGFKVEATIESNEPTSETEKQFCERGMYVEIVLAKNIVSCEFAKVDLIEAMLRWLHVQQYKSGENDANSGEYTYTTWSGWFIL
jgi:hypothetical protein